MLTGTHSRTVAEFNLSGGRSSELVAHIEFNVLEGSPRTYWEPGEETTAEATDVTLVEIITRYDFGTGAKTVTETVRECPLWLRDSIIEDAQDDLDAEARELLGDDYAGDDDAFEMRRAAE